MRRREIIVDGNRSHSSTYAVYDGGGDIASIRRRKEIERTFSLVTVKVQMSAIAGGRVCG